MRFDGVLLVGNSAASLRTGGRVVAVTILTFVLASSSLSANSDKSPGEKVNLQSGWALQSSCQFSASGEQISAAGFKTDGWHSTDVPSTVVAALVADKT